MKIIIVINLECVCVRTSAEDNDFQRGMGCVCLMILFNLRGVMVWSVRLYNVIPGQFGFAR